MSRTIKVVVTDAIYEALLAESAHDGQLASPGQGVATVMRKAARAWLNKQGHKASILDMDDGSYGFAVANELPGLPGTRKGSSE